MAIKLLAPQAELDDPAARARFDREIRILAETRHPNLVELLDHGVDEELGPYLVMPRVEGVTLRELLTGVRACPEAVLLLLAPIVSALDVLHRSGLVHRDLKPENIMVGHDGQVKLVDLGLAYGQGYTRYTEEGSVVGSVPYMSPEQVEGAQVEAACDIWAVGVMAYEWMVGKRPFARERPAEEAAAILVGAYSPLSAQDRRASREFSEAVGACLSRAPTERPSASELHAGIAVLIDWVDSDGLPAECAALVGDPGGYQARVAPARISRLKREAEEAIGRGESFAALAVIDRALAYGPDDGELRSLCERAEAAEVRPPVAAVEGPQTGAEQASAAAPRSRRRMVVVALAGVAIIAVLSSVAFLAPGSEETPEERDRRQTEAALKLFGGMMQTVERGMHQPGVRAKVQANPEEAEAALKLFGGMMHLYERGLDLQEKIAEQSAASDAGVVADAE